MPDSVLERADEIELVDIAPEELLERLARGEGLPARAGASAPREHFFKRGQPARAARARAAPHGRARRRGRARGVPRGARRRRDLADRRAHPRLRRAGARLGAARSSRAADGRGAARAVGRGLRRADRPGRRSATKDRERLEAHLRLAESLGASVARLGAGRISDAHPRLRAAGSNVTRIVARQADATPAWRDRLRGSLLDEVVRGSGEIEVHVISATPSGRRASRRARGWPRRRATPRRTRSRLSIVALTTALAAGVRALHPVPDVEMLYLLAVMIAAHQARPRLVHPRGRARGRRLRLLLRPALRTRSRWRTRATSSPSR